MNGIGLIDLPKSRRINALLDIFTQVPPVLLKRYESKLKIVNSVSYSLPFENEEVVSSPPPEAIQENFTEKVQNKNSNRQNNSRSPPPRYSVCTPNAAPTFAVTVIDADLGPDHLLSFWCFGASVGNSTTEI